MKKFVSVSILFLFSLMLHAQKQMVAAIPSKNIASSPGLVVGIVVDQMRYDYLFKFWNKYSNDGFKRLVNDGFLFSNANYNYIPTNTAPGHACIYTGTTPSVNGIINNEWYDYTQKKNIYCVNDTTVKSIGTTSISGKMSPRNLLTSTITDELRMATNMKSKVIGIALKDRGAILPAGNTGTAYWHDPFSNNFVTSSYYMNQLPAWVDEFNKRKLCDSLTNQKWTTLLPIETYTESSADDTPYEGMYTGETKPVFPHDLPELKKNEGELIRQTPFGNTLTKEFAEAAVKGENLGKGAAMDFLAVSFSSTDYVGHLFGINAIELEDTYLRLDRDLATFLRFLDAWTGNNYLLFLTADHGAPSNPMYTIDQKLKGGKYEPGASNDSLKKYISNYFGDDSLIEQAGTHGIYLNRKYIDVKKMDIGIIQNKCASFITKMNGVSVAMTSTELSKGIARTGIYSLIQNGYNVQRSADVLIQLQPGWLDWFTKTGTTHGSVYSYDTHVPVIFFGNRIKPGTSADPVSICDISPTLASLLHIEFPNGNSGKPLVQLMKQ